MKPEYHSWIRACYPTAESARLQCKEAVTLMTSVFPELLPTRGQALVRGQWRPHWWCRTAAGEVVDPSAHQWEVPVVVYDALADDAEEPLGKYRNVSDGTAHLEP